MNQPSPHGSPPPVTRWVTAWARCRPPSNAEQLRHLQRLPQVPGTGVGHGVAELQGQLRLLLPGEAKCSGAPRGMGKKWWFNDGWLDGRLR